MWNVCGGKFYYGNTKMYWDREACFSVIQAAPFSAISVLTAGSGTPQPLCTFTSRANSRSASLSREKPLRAPFFPQGYLECHPWAFSELMILFQRVFVGSSRAHPHTSSSMCDVHHTESTLPRGVNSEPSKRLSFVSKCLHSENCRLQIRAVNQ